MGRRGESIFKRKDGRWEARYKVGMGSSGSARYRSVYGKTYSDAKEKRRAAMKEDYIPQSKNCFSDVISRWLRSKETDVKASTMQKYRQCSFSLKRLNFTDIFHPSTICNIFPKNADFQILYVPVQRALSSTMQIPLSSAQFERCQ